MRAFTQCRGSTVIGSAISSSMNDETRLAHWLSRCVCTPGPLDTPCLIWPGSKNEHGYALVGFRGRTSRLHRVAYELLVGPIAPGLVIDHLCRNRGCVAVGHLEPVSNAENIRRGWQDNPDRPRPPRPLPTACRAGHPFSSDNILTRRLSGGGTARRCRTCEVAYQAQWHQRRQLRNRLAKVAGE